MPETKAIGQFIRARGTSALALAKRGRLTEDEANRLNRWLGALADDIEAGLHLPLSAMTQEG